MPPTKTSLALLFVDKRTVVTGVLVLLVAFIIGVIIGYFGKSNGNESILLEKYSTDQFKKNKVRNKSLLGSIIIIHIIATNKSTLNNTFKILNDCDESHRM